MKRLWLMLIFVGVTKGLDAQSLSNRLSPALNRTLVLARPDDSVTVSVSFQTDAAAKTIVGKSVYANIQLVRMAATDLALWASRKDVLFINEHHPAKEELNTGTVDYTTNSVVLAQQLFPTVNAGHLKFIVKERRFDPEDIDLAGRTFNTTLEDRTITAHAGLMATIIGSAGNSSPFAKGVAVAALGGSVNFQNLFPENDSFYQRHKISVQNHSYGTVVENFYGNEAAAFDGVAFRNPELLFVFSAGNSGNVTNTTGSYAGIRGFATLTGNFKQSKNGLVVGAVDSALQVMDAASKGPAFDGRIKPEIVAYGEDGTSGAAALASGTALLVADAYQKKTGRTAPAALMKAAIVNSADDVGAAGPDYASGFGNLNTYAAVNSIAQNNFIIDSLLPAEQKTYSLNIPPRAVRTRLTLVWTDAPAQAGSTNVLVNDLNMQVRNGASGTIWLPLVLNPAANMDSLSAPARMGVDTINNVEQIIIHQPLAGGYQIQVQFAKGVNGRQSFAIVYQTDTAAHFLYSYPLRSTPVLAASKQRIRWQTTDTGQYKFEYGLNNIWMNIGIADAQHRFIMWNVPDVNSKVLLRATAVSSNRVIYSDSFVISRQPLLRTAYNCKDSLSLVWNIVGSGTDVQRLVNQYLTMVRTTNDSTAVFASNSGDPHFAVTPLINGWPGVRSNAINVRAAGSSCFLESFFLQEQMGNTARFTAQLGTNVGVRSILFEKLLPGGPEVRDIVNSPFNTRFTFTDLRLTPGQNRYRLKITLANGSIIYSDEEVVYYTTAEQPLYAYPNPASAQQPLRIIVQEAGKYRIRIHNSIGQPIYEGPINNSPTILPHRIFRAGVYYMHVWDGEGKRWVQKIVVQ